MGKTGVTGYVVNGTNHAERVTVHDLAGVTVVLDEAGVEIAIDPGDFGSIWLTHRAVSTAVSRLGAAYKGSLHVVDLRKISAELAKDKRALRFTTAQFVEKMGGSRANQIITGLVATYGKKAAAPVAEKEVAAA